MAQNVSVLMVSMGFQGHMNLMIKFSNILASKGVHVTLISTEIARGFMQKYINTPQKFDLAFFSDGLSFDIDRVKHHDMLFKSLKEHGPKNLSNLITNLSHSRDYSYMIINPFLPWAVDVAHQLGIPCAMLWTQAISVYSIYYRYYKNINNFPSLDDLDEIVKLPGLPVLKVRELPTFMLPSAAQSVRDMQRDVIMSLNKVKLVLSTSFDEMEGEIVKSMESPTPVWSIGPLVSPFLLGQQETNVCVVDSCIDWLDGKPKFSVIYVAFGSIVLLTQNQMDNLALALKNSKKPFLWVIKKSEEENNDNVGKLSHEFLEETKGRGMVVAWCQQEKVLMHPSVGCFLTHNGYNSMIEAMVAGVPLISYPQWSDDPLNAKMCTNVYGNAMAVKCDEDGVAMAEEIEKCIREVMEGPKGVEIKKKALKIKEAARKSVQQGGSSDRNLNQFISELINVEN